MYIASWPLALIIIIDAIIYIAPLTTKNEKCDGDNDDDENNVKKECSNEQWRFEVNENRVKWIFKNVTKGSKSCFR